jgi:hypothetical protein
MNCSFYFGVTVRFNVRTPVCVQEVQTSNIGLKVDNFEFMIFPVPPPCRCKKSPLHWPHPFFKLNSGSIKWSIPPLHILKQFVACIWFSGRINNIYWHTHTHTHIYGYVYVCIYIYIYIYIYIETQWHTDKLYLSVANIRPTECWNNLLTNQDII